MSEIATSPTPEVTTAATPSAPADSTPGTVQTPASEASTGQAAPSQEETFYSGDPNSLPPELREKYNAMLTDYKKKTTGLAEERKRTAESLKKADLYDKISQDQKFVEYWNGLSKQQKSDYQEKKAEAEKSLGESISDEDFAKAFENKGSFLSLIERAIQEKRQTDQKKIAELEQKNTTNEAANIAESFATEKGKDGQLVRPDFYDLEENNLISGYLSVNAPKDIGEYQAKLNEAYSWAKNISQKYYEKGKAEALSIIQKKAASSTEMPTNAAKTVYDGKDPKKLDAREAFALAKRGIKIPQ